MSYWYMSAVPFAMVVPFVMALLRLHALPRYATAIVWLLVLSGLTQLTITFLANQGVNNMPFFHFYTVAEMALVVLFFAHLPDFKHAAKIVYGIGVAFLAFAILNTLYVQDLHHFNSYARSIEALIVIALCFAYFARQLNTDNLSYRDPAMWFVTGLFIYFSASFIIFLISDLSLVLDKYFDWVLWNLHATIVLIMYILYTAGFARCHR